MTAAAVPASMGESQHDASLRELGRVGRSLVAVLVVGGMWLALQGDFSILWYPPFAGVGALLAIRRPRTPIGWILLACGFGFVIVNIPTHATSADFEAGRIDPLTLVTAIATVAAGPVVFAMFSALALIFPSGRLPGGRWGRVARAALAVSIACIVLGIQSPTILVSLWNDTSVATPVRNPLSLFPDLPIWSVLTTDLLILPVVAIMAGSAVSIFVRYRHAAGVERQQLRWITATLVIVVLGVLTGFVLLLLLPSLADPGLVWLGAGLSFPLVPIAVGFAVMRYRLYGIDTIINRALVYSLLTAILAGASAATIGITRQLFEGLLGPGSDLSIVISTLVVVSAFEPIKKRVQALVDRRFHESADPVVALAGLVTEVRGLLGRPGPERTMERALTVAVRATHATSGRISWSLPDGTTGIFEERADAATSHAARATAPSGAAPLVATAVSGGASATIELADVLDRGLTTPLIATLGSLLTELRRA